MLTGEGQIGPIQCTHGPRRSNTGDAAGQSCPGARCVIVKSCASSALHAQALGRRHVLVRHFVVRDRGLDVGNGH